MSQKLSDAQIHTIQLGFVLGNIEAVIRVPEWEFHLNHKERFDVMRRSLDRLPGFLSAATLPQHLETRIQSTIDTLNTEWDIGGRVINQEGLEAYLEGIRRHVGALRKDLGSLASDSTRTCLLLGFCLGNSDFRSTRQMADGNHAIHAEVNPADRASNWEFDDRELLDSCLSTTGLTLDFFLLRSDTTENHPEAPARLSSYSHWEEIEQAFGRLHADAIVPAESPQHMSDSTPSQTDPPWLISGISHGSDHSTPVRRKLPDGHEAQIDFTMSEFNLFSKFYKADEHTVRKSELNEQWNQITGRDPSSSGSAIQNLISKANQKLSVLKLEIKLVTKGSGSSSVWRLSEKSSTKPTDLEAPSKPLNDRVQANELGPAAE